MILEALRNVARHAGACECEVRIEVTEDDLRATISDTGRGFDSQQREGVGIQSMRERAAELGGELHILTNEPTGTIVRVSIPVPTRGL